MSLESERFDVWVLSTPPTTPQGERFAPTLARVFGVALDIAERIARQAPLVVKRGVTLDEAARLGKTLEVLGTEVEIVPAKATPRSVSSLPTASTTGTPSGTVSIPPSGVMPPPRASARLSSRPPRFDGGAASARPAPGSVAPPPMSRPWTPLPPAPRTLNVSPAAVLLGGALLLALALAGATRWLRAQSDERALGTQRPPETSCESKAGAAGPSLEECLKARLGAEAARDH